MSILSQRRRAIISVCGRRLIDSGKCGANAYWKLYDDDTLEISGTGGLDNYSTAENQPYREYIDEMTQIKIKDGITSIGNNAFSECTSLALTELSSGITSIGKYAFEFCIYLASIELPSGLTSIGSSAFRGCTNLALTGLPDGITSIADHAFAGCVNLALTKLPSGLTSIGDSAFRGCALKKVIFTSTPATLAGNAFYLCDDLLDIYVPWAEGEVAGAPWGASNATIHYNWTGGTA